MRAFAPAWVVFWADHVRPGQFAIWAPYLRRMRQRTLVMSSRDNVDGTVRDAVEAMADCAIAEPYADVIGWLKDVPELRGFLYVGSREANAAVIDAFPEAAHVWIGHGESAKKANRHRTTNVYDAVFVADYSAVERYGPRIRRWVGAHACGIGVPVVEGLTADPWTTPRTIRSILYAPTWEGRGERADYGSLPLVAPILVAAMPDLRTRGVEVIVRPHPSTGHRIPDLTGLVTGLLDAGAVAEPDKAAAMTRADVLIGDVSGLTSEFLFTRKPILLPVGADLLQIIDAATLRREYPFAYHWDPDREGLLPRLAALERADPLAATRATEAERVFRGHRTIDEAVATFEIGLDAASRRSRWLSVRHAFELRRRLGRRHA